MIDTKAMRAKYATKHGRAPAGAVDVRALCDELDKYGVFRFCQLCRSRYTKVCDVCHEKQQWEPWPAK
jgi:hypothetical protein